MEIDSTNCMCGGMKDKEKWNVTEEASDAAENLACEVEGNYWHRNSSQLTW